MMQALFTPVRESYESLQEFTRVFAQKCLKMSINSWRDGIGEEDGVGGEGHECGEEEKAELVIPAMVYRIFRKYMPVLFLLQGVSIEVCSPEWGAGREGERSGDKEGKVGVHWEANSTNS